jgi:endonuclease VIII
LAHRSELNLYGCEIRVIEGSLDVVYDWRGDVLSESWDPAAARRKLRPMPGTLVCDALLDQNIFAGVGNIIRNEVLFRIRVHPLSTVGALPPAKLRALVEQARQYGFDFLERKSRPENHDRHALRRNRRCVVRNLTDAAVLPGSTSARAGPPGPWRRGRRRVQ